MSTHEMIDLEPAERSLPAIAGGPQPELADLAKEDTTGIRAGTLSTADIRKRFKPKCVVDWLDLEFRYLSPTPAWRIYEKGAGVFSCVTGLDTDSGNDIAETGAQGRNTPTKRFRARIQSPDRFSSIIDALATRGIAERIDPNAGILVAAIEVSFDLYALPATTEEDLASMTATLASKVVRVSDAQPRRYRRRGETSLLFTNRDLADAIKGGFTVGFGHRDDDAYQRCYLKQFDNGSEPLPANARRARVEVCLKADACPVRTLAELRDFEFSSLAKFFKFRQNDPRLSGLMAQVIDRRASNGGVLDDLGRVTEAFRYRGRKRKNAPHTMASPLNEIARDQLRKLTARWRTEAGRERTKERPASCATRHEYSGGHASCAVMSRPQQQPCPNQAQT